MILSGVPATTAFLVNTVTVALADDNVLLQEGMSRRPGG
jgi:hypothetical protein